MSELIQTVEEAVLAMGDPSNPAWAEAFRFLCGHPETAGIMIETFRETLEQMGVEPSDTDPATGQPRYKLEDVARATGVPKADLDTDTCESSDR